MPLPRLIARSCLRVITIIIIIIIIITRVSILSKPINLPRILSRLQLEVPSKPNKLLMLCYNRLNLKRRQC